MFSFIICLFGLSFSELIFTGNKTFDERLASQKIVILSMGEGGDTDIIKKIFNDEKLTYDCIDVSYFKHTYYDIKRRLSELPPKKNPNMVFPAVIINKRYIGSYRELFEFQLNKEIGKIVEGKIIRGSLIFHDTDRATEL